MTHALKRLGCFIYGFSLCIPAFSQNFNWNNYVRSSNTPVGPSNYTVAYTSGTLTTIMTVSITSSAGTGIFTSSSPKYSNSTNPMGTSSTCMPTGLLIGVDWANKTSYVQLDFNLGNGTEGVCGPVKFSIGDINSDGSTFQDMVDITATRSNGTAITPNKPASIPPNNSYITGGCSYSWSYSDCNQSSTVGNILRYTGSSACTDWANNFVEVGTSSDKVKSISIKYYSGSAASTNPAAQYIVISNMLTSGFTPCSIGYVLPIELTSFNAYKTMNDQVDLQWETASEKNNHYFTVERSDDGTTFREVGQVQGSGNSLIRHNYTFTDEAPLPGVSYYRLRQTDFDNTSQYSGIVSVEIAPSRIAVSGIHPNPANDLIDFDIYTPEKTNAVVDIVDFSGFTRQSLNQPLEKGKNPVRMDLGALPQGIYMLRVSIDGVSAGAYSKLIKN
ncbi:MAG: T9SS type A sorting domain-containing protein [Bacteroidetes bacterium]|nr:T9SS type A sorting domain-containing protein [Bacteroidota bacterium]